MNHMTRRSLSLAAAGALAALSLSGCIKVTGDVTIDSQALATGTIGFELQKQAAGLMGITDLDSFKVQLTEGDLADQSSGLFANGTCTASETDVNYIYTCSYSGATFDKPDDPWTITKTGDTIVFHMAEEGSGTTDGAASPDASAAPDLLGGASLGEIVVSVTFPGPIQTVTGKGAEKTSDTTAKVTSSLTDKFDVTIVSGVGGGGLPILLIAGLAILALIIIGVIVMLVTRRKPAPELISEAAGVSAMGVGAVVVAEGMVVEETVIADETVVEEVVIIDETDVEGVASADEQ